MSATAGTATRELGVFLRRQRERLAPPDDGARRRTPGLRREEVAERAGVSIDYVVRLEQGRLHPSAEVLAALAAALGLTDDERAYVADLAQHRGADPTPAPQGHSSPTARLVHDLSPLPAMLLDHRLDILDWNREMAALMIDFASVPARGRNSMELCLFHPSLGGFYPDREQVVREGVADLRAAWATQPHDARLGALIEGWCTRSAEFERLWEQRDVRVNGRGRKRIDHPDVGPLSVDYEVLNPLSAPGERLVIYRASDADSRAALDRLLPATAATRAAAG